MPVKTEEIRSTDDLVISPVKELTTGGHHWDVDKVYQKETLVTVKDTNFTGELTHRQYLSVIANNIGNNPLTDTANWVEDNIVKYISTDTEVTVGVGGSFTSIYAALVSLQRYVMINDTTMIIRCLSNHVEVPFILEHNTFVGTLEIRTDGTPLTFDTNGISRNGVFRYTGAIVAIYDCTINIVGSPTQTSNNVNYLCNFKDFSYFSCTININATPPQPEFWTYLAGYDMVDTIYNMNATNLWAGLRDFNRVTRVKVVGNMANRPIFAYCKAIGTCDILHAHNFDTIVYAGYGSETHCFNFNTQEAGIKAPNDVAFRVSQGSIICATGSTGTSNIATNTVTAHGIIFK